MPNKTGVVQVVHAFNDLTDIAAEGQILIGRIVKGELLYKIIRLDITQNGHLTARGGLTQVVGKYIDKFMALTAELLAVICLIKLSV